jgi:hypothetical protein
MKRLSEASIAYEQQLLKGNFLYRRQFARLQDRSKLFEMTDAMQADG